MSPSKTFNLPGLNFAFAVIPDEGLRRRFTTAAEGLLPFPGCFALAAAEAAYREGGPWLEELLDYLRGNRDLVERIVAEELPGVTTTHVEATYLSWLDARGLGVADPARLFREAGVALSDGVDFGAPGFLRLNFACPRSTLDEALARMRRAVAGTLAPARPPRRALRRYTCTSRRSNVSHATSAAPTITASSTAA